MGAFFHFFAHDQEGPIGMALRSAFKVGDGALMLGLDDRAFAMVVVSVCMQIVGILQLPVFYGPSFSPFSVPIKIMDQIWQAYGPPADAKNATPSKDESVPGAVPASPKTASSKKKKN